MLPDNQPSFFGIKELFAPAGRPDLSCDGLDGAAIEIIHRRLNYCKWSGPVDEAINRDAFWALMTAANGHPRRAFAVLRRLFAIEPANPA